MIDALPSVMEATVAEEMDVAANSAAAGRGGTRPRPHLPRSSPAQVLGDVVWLMSQSPAHRHLFLADIEWLVLPAVLIKQFRLFKVGNKPYAFASWASLSEQVAARVTGGNPRLAPGEWKCGDQAWLMDLVAPFGGAEGVLKELKEKVFADRELMTVRRDVDGVTVGEVGGRGGGA